MTDMLDCIAKTNLADETDMTDPTGQIGMSSLLAPIRLITILGGQWGDEGKAKAIHSLLESLLQVRLNKKTISKVPTETVRVAGARFCGGDNAGHTVVLEDGTKVKFRLIPTAALCPGALAIIGPQCLMNLKTLKTEVEALEALGVSDIRQRLRIAFNAHVVTEDHIRQDVLLEERKGSNAVGTTGRGIGPCNAGKANRTNLRVEDLRSEFEEFGKVVDTQELFEQMEEEGEKAWKAVADAEKKFNSVFREVQAESRQQLDQSYNLQSFADSKLAEAQEELKRVKRENPVWTVVMEGAQSLELDIDWGGYPYVTSSSTRHAAIYSTGIPQNAMENSVVLVVKGYCTYVGKRQFQPEGEVFTAIAEVGGEFGTVTGRPRQVNYLDLSRLRKNIRNCRTATGKVVVMVNKMDVLEEVAKKHGEKAYGLILPGGETVHFQTMAEMQTRIRVEVLKMGASQVIFSETPKADPKVFESIF